MAADAKEKPKEEVENNASTSSCGNRLHFAFCIIWATIVGLSIPLGMVNAIFLNSHAYKEDRQYHAFYVSNLAVAMGGLQSLPLCMRPSKPASRSLRGWHFLGGLGSLPAFLTVSAGSVVGTQKVLVVQLAALLPSFFVIDLVDGRVTGYAKVLALVVIFIGVVLEGDDQELESGDPWAVLLLPLVALTGIGYAMQSKCNNALAEALGSSARATVVSAFVFLFCSLPINSYMYFSLGIRISLDIDFWYLWIAAGFQSAFYTGSMAHLPGVLGFTSCYVITLASKLSTSLVLDSNGLSGQVVPLTTCRVVALIMVLLGSIVFNVGSKKDDLQHLSTSQACMVNDGDLEVTLTPSLKMPTQKGLS